MSKCLKIRPNTCGRERGRRGSAQTSRFLGFSSCEPRKRNPALFPASPSPSHKYLGCVLAPLVKKQKPYNNNNNNNNNNNSNNKNNICCIIAFPSSRGTQPRVIASGPGCGWRGVGALWLFQCAGIWIRIIRKSEPGEHARIWRVRQVRTFLW